MTTWLADWQGVEHSPELQVHLPPKAFVAPAGTALLAACIASRSSRGLVTRINVNSDGDSYRYLQRMDFFHGLGLELPEKFRRHAPDGRFVPLRPITTRAEAQRFAEETCATVMSNRPLSTSLSRRTQLHLNELADNIVDHAEAGRTGFGMAQVMHKSGRLEYAIGDYGIGILASLSKNPELLGRLGGHAAAIQCAVEGNSCDTDGRRHGGIGLSMLLNDSDQLGAEVRIISGTALFRRHTVAAPPIAGRMRSSSRQTERRETPAFQGTLVCVSVPLPS